MSLIKTSVVAFACTWMVSFLVACGGNTADQSTEQSSVDQETATRNLMSAHQASLEAIDNAGVVPMVPIDTGNGVVNAPAVNVPGNGVVTAPASGAACNLSVQGAPAGLDASQIFGDLQTKFQALFNNVQSQDLTGFSADLQALQQSLQNSLGDFLNQLQACLPSGQGAANQPPAQALNPAAGLQGLQIPQFLGQVGGAH